MKCTAHEGLVLVISRPCNALRSDRVVVAPIVDRKLKGLEGLSSFEEFKRFFTGIRDGFDTPDGFYLGELEPGSNVRHYAKLDRLCTIVIPSEKSQEARTLFIKEYRRFQMTLDFARDLHLRAFRAVASLGFDDERWWSDDDLVFVVKRGKAEDDALEAEIRRLDSELDKLMIGEGARKEHKSTEHALAAKRKDLDELRQDLAPLQRELESRGRK